MNKPALTLLFATLAALPLGAVISEPVKVDGGLISGTPGWGWGVREFRGIPFAAPPVGNLRWRPPQSGPRAHRSRGRRRRPAGFRS